MMQGAGDGAAATTAKWWSSSDNDGVEQGHLRWRAGDRCKVHVAFLFSTSSSSSLLFFLFSLLSSSSLLLSSFLPLFCLGAGFGSVEQFFFFFFFARDGYEDGAMMWALGDAGGIG